MEVKKPTTHLTTMIDVLIDKLTNSIKNRASGDVFDTEVLPVTDKDLKTVNKKQG